MGWCERREGRADPVQREGAGSDGPESTRGRGDPGRAGGEHPTGEGETKKLEGAAAYWYDPFDGVVARDLRQAREEAEALGVILDVDDDDLQPDAPDYEVWPENWPAVDLFLRCQTQWRTGGMGSVIGLDYQAVLGVGNMVPTADPLQRMEDLQVIESRVLELFQETAARQRAKQKREAG